MISQTIFRFRRPIREAANLPFGAFKYTGPRGELSLDFRARRTFGIVQTAHGVAIGIP